MILAVLVATLSPSPVRAELVEAPVAREARGPSTGSGRTVRGQGSALDAERAFAADAQTLGQWTAFRKWAAPDATMFVPQPINAQAWLKDRRDPAHAIEWWPTASYVSCDGSLAVNTGGWKTHDGSVGYFSTVWQRQQDGGWKWIVDGGDDLKAARLKPQKLKVSISRCAGKPGTPPQWIYEHITYQTNGRTSADATLSWRWEVFKDGRRRFYAHAWNGSGWDEIVSDSIAAQ